MFSNRLQVSGVKTVFAQCGGSNPTHSAQQALDGDAETTTRPPTIENTVTARPRR